MYKIFIADDEAIIREGIACLLDYESLGFSIAREAVTGKTACQGILELSPDVVFLDIRMPEMSGFEVIREAKWIIYFFLLVLRYILLLPVLIVSE